MTQKCRYFWVETNSYHYFLSIVIPELNVDLVLIVLLCIGTKVLDKISEDVFLIVKC